MNSGAYPPGFTLVEVLVALLVLSVGLLGVAKLCATSLRAERASANRLAALTLASDMADRIRANRDGHYDGTGPGTDQGCARGAAECSPDALAQDDWWHWLQDIHQRLPAGGRANVTAAELPPVTQYVITLSWPEAGYAQPASYTLALQL